MSIDKTAIEEANKHLFALAQKVEDLERKNVELQELLVQKEIDSKRELDSVIRLKDNEIKKHQTWLNSTEVEIRRLTSQLSQKNKEIKQLTRRCNTLDKIAGLKPELNKLVQYISEDRKYLIKEDDNVDIRMKFHESKINNPPQTLLNGEVETNIGANNERKSANEIIKNANEDAECEIEKTKNEANEEKPKEVNHQNEEDLPEIKEDTATSRNDQMESDADDEPQKYELSTIQDIEEEKETKVLKSKALPGVAKRTLSSEINTQDDDELDINHLETTL